MLVLLTCWNEKRLRFLKFFIIFLTIGHELYFSIMISIAFDMFVFSWSKLLAGLIPGVFLRNIKIIFCIESVRIWSFSGLHFPSFELNTNRFHAFEYQNPRTKEFWPR